MPDNDQEPALGLRDVVVDGVLPGRRLRIPELRLDPGDVLGFVHPSSLNRHAWRRLCLGLSPSLEGQRRLLGLDPAQCARNEARHVRSCVGWVHDPPLFLRNVPVMDNLALPLRYHTKRSESDIRATLREVLARFGIDDPLVKTPPGFGYNTLRIAALARALGAEKGLVVVENTDRTFLESENSESFRAMIGERRAAGTAVLLMATDEAALSGLGIPLATLEGGGELLEGAD